MSSPGDRAIDMIMNAIWRTYFKESPPMQQQFDIGRAVTEMRHHGNKVRRAGWNVKGMYLVYQKAYPEGIPINENTANATGIPKGTVCAFLPYVMMRTADGAFVPWLCSQTDLLATDWEIAL